MIHIILFIFIIVIIIYLGLAIILYFSQSKLLFHPYKELNLIPIDIGLNYEDVTFNSADGKKLNGWFIPCLKSGKCKTILLSHGNAGNMSNRLETIKIFHKLNLSVFIYDYQGYGKSEGHPSEKNTYNDALGAWNYLTETKKIPSSEIIIFGRSLGGALAAYLASKKEAAGVILESTFTSVTDIAKKFYPIFPIKPLIRNKYPTIDIVDKIKNPVLVIHSHEDELIPFSHGTNLFEKIKSPKKFIEISGVHKDGYLTTGNKYSEAIFEFVNDL